MLKNTFTKRIEDSIKLNWDLNCFSNYKGESLKYSETADKIKKLHSIFEKCGIEKEDKIAVIGKSSINWGLIYISVITYGAVIVPILNDFHADDIHHIVNHSDSVLLFSTQYIYEKLEDSKMTKLKGIISLDDFSVLNSEEIDINDISDIYSSIDITDKDSFSLPNIHNDDLAAIVYTSGTTGFSKGAMLPHKSLYANVQFADDTLPLSSGHRMLSFLPLAHAYGCAFEFLYPFCIGAEVVFLGKIPSPKILLKAFSDVKPNLILSVPLILEKIYRKQLKKAMEKTSIKIMTKIPILSDFIYKKISERLIEVFGGEFIEIVIGGAALNKEVEEFLRQINFPFTVGYGMTECGPLISYTGWKEHAMYSVGKVIPFLKVKIDSPDPYNIVGEIMVKGLNVMEGYYKNPEASKEALDANGWLHTGDLGLIDKEGNIYIKGRSKNMILGPSGQNIYPEEIESKMNNLPFVQESMVLEQNGKIKALVYPDYDSVDSAGLSESDLEDRMQDNRKVLNDSLPSYISIAEIKLFPEEFEKTPTKKIKRFLYKNA